MQRELQIVLAAASPAPDAAQWLARRLREGVDWDVTVEQAVSHGVATRLYSALDGVERDLVPSGPRRRLEAHCFSVVAQNLPRVEQLVDTVTTLEEAGIETVAFKGPLLEATLGRDPLARESTDLDILIDRSDVGRATAVLAAAGYWALEPDRMERDRRRRPLQKHYLFDSAEGPLATLELHAEVMEPDWAVDLPTRQLLARSRAVDFRGVTLRQLSTEDLLLALALHGTGHGWRRAMWLGDLGGLLAQATEAQVASALDRATDVGCRRILVVAGELACRLLRLRPAGSLEAALRQDPVARTLASRMARKIGEPLADLAALRLPVIDRLRIRERAGDTWTLAKRHVRKNCFELADRALGSTAG